MGHLKIRRVKYNGDKYHYISPELKNGLNIIEGPNGTGKTTFMNIIYYCLSGYVPEFEESGGSRHTEINSDKNNYAEVDVSISGANYTLRRIISTKEIAVISGEQIDVYPIFRSPSSDMIFSDWFLDKLGIEVVELYQGGSTFKINVKDLFRLVYHNQEADPGKIYKSPDRENYITDSEVLRKTIFQILTGKTFNDYYSLLAQFKDAEKVRSIEKSVLDEFGSMIDSLTDTRERINLVHLKEKHIVLGEQLERLYTFRSSLKGKKNIPSESLARVNTLKAEIVALDIEQNNLRNEEINILGELNKLHRLKEQIILEVTQIKKIIFTHESLNLFSPDTCPYCLNQVKREEAKCVCGSDVDEQEFERFFYTKDEYLGILKTKQKSVQTVDLAIESCSEEYLKIKESFSQSEEKRKRHHNLIKEIIEAIDDKFDTTTIDEVDDNVVELKTQISELDQRIEFEQKLEKLQRDFEKSNTRYIELKNQLRLLESQAYSDISVIVELFSSKYNVLMQNALTDCRIARIDADNYMPIINNGEYREASSKVPIRLMYYFTLLSLSLSEQGVKYPSFLMVDTPRTAGIDLPNLIKSLSQIENVSEEIGPDSDFQVILSTGVNIYKEGYEQYVFERLSDDDRLLKPSH